MHNTSGQFHEPDTARVFSQQTLHTKWRFYVNRSNNSPHKRYCDYSLRMLFGTTFERYCDKNRWVLNQFQSRKLHRRIGQSLASSKFSLGRFIDWDLTSQVSLSRESFKFVVSKIIMVFTVTSSTCDRAYSHAAALRAFEN